MPYRILALDGGGFRALIPAALVQRLQELRPGFLPGADLIAGSSTSGITALLLAAEDDWTHAVETCRTFWVNFGQLLKADTLRELTALAGKAAYFDTKALAAALKTHFGDRTLGELKRKVVIPTLALDADGQGWAPRILQNLDATHAGMTVREAALQAVAVPVLFPVRHGVIDGSLLANNPTLCAMTEAIRAGLAGLPDMRVLSIGAGLNPMGLKVNNADMGYADWLFDHDRPLLLLQAAAENACRLTDSQCALLLAQGHYLRMNPRLPKAAPLFEHSPRFVVQAGDLADAADLAPCMEWLEGAGWITPAEETTQDDQG